MKPNLRKVVTASLLAALTCVATMIIRIPSPLHGYINLGDSIVLVSGWLLGPVYGFLAAGIGSMLADIFAGYAVYAPVTFAVKGLTAVAAYLLMKTLAKTKIKGIPGYIISGIPAEAVMIGGYYIFEGFMYGFVQSLVNIPPNAVQAAAGIIAGTMVIAVINKTGIIKKLK